MTVLKLHIGAMHLYHLAQNGYSTNVNWMNELIPLTLNGDFHHPWQVIHHLHPSTLLLIVLLLQQEFLQGSVLQRQSHCSTDVCHYHWRGSRTSLDAIPLGWLRRSRRKTSKRSSLSLSQCFFICFLSSSSFRLPSHTHTDNPPSPIAICSLLERHTHTSQVSF